MRAVLFDRFGGPEVLRIAEQPTPEPGRGEVLIRVGWHAVNPKDVLVRKGRFRWLTGRHFPMRVGYDLAGVVAAAGPGGDLPTGTPVFGMINAIGGGACATHAIARATEIARAPADIPLAEAAAVPLVAQTALQSLRDLARLRPGQRVLISGASGGLGTVAIQVARILDAHVTAVCSHRNLELCAALGAHEVVDYTKQDPTALDARFDVFFDVFGNRSRAAAQHVLRPRGTYVGTIPSPRAVLLHVVTRWSRQRSALVVVRSRRADLDTLRAWMEAGRLRAVIDRTVALDDIAEAHRYIESRRARGKILVETAA